MAKLTDEQAERIGERIAELLGLKRAPGYRTGYDIRFDTKWGSKTPIGLTRSIVRIIEEGLEP